MKPYGKKKIKHNYKDNHPDKRFINWWEDINSNPNKKSERQKSKKEIIKEK